MFVPYDLTEATLSVTNAAGHLKKDGETRPLKTESEIPVRGGSVSRQLEQYLESRFGRGELCEYEPTMQEHYHVTIKRRLLFLYTSEGPHPTITVETEALNSYELTPAMLKFVAGYESPSGTKILHSGRGVQVSLTIPATIFVGQNLEQAIRTVLAVAKDVHTKARQTRKPKGDPQP